MNTPLVVTREGNCALVTLNRPAARNALTGELIRQLRATLKSLDSDPNVHAIVLTGADPAFCAGLDLKELVSTGDNLNVGADPDAAHPSDPWASLGTPIIGAVNGACVTGGLELALACDFLIASEHAYFGDTHARVSLVPSWGMSVRLPLLVGRGLARRMSLTGQFIGAQEALAAGLVTQLVEHDQLITTALGCATAVAECDARAVATVLDTYRSIERHATAAGLDVEAAASKRWLREAFDPATVGARRVPAQDAARAQLADARTIPTDSDRG